MMIDRDIDLMFEQEDREHDSERQRSDEAQAWIDASAFVRETDSEGRWETLIWVRGVVIADFETVLTEHAPGGESRVRPHWINSRGGLRFSREKLISQYWEERKIRYNTLTEEIKPR